jgi:hypothetical protein
MLCAATADPDAAAGRSPLALNVRAAELQVCGS